ncbi:TerB family tellurite resistance protein [Piscinibacter koreensis]|uniref:TerB family tellurite resistance protein n=1 Tax=Piscinibacter koreensis TaxID=2742824 RepID=A0A7Y6NK33_9BURK|nr:TerB family tellurite resistance protein [Schlegelella koreensis]NUZ04617.1 TerB family tellurite resistance protein [Schlegelella koreensis]
MNQGNFRTYPRNSPPAAARIVAAALLANGDIKAVEWRRLTQLDAVARLGLQGLQWDAVLDDLCEDLMNGKTDTGDALIEHATLAAWLGEVDDTALQTLVLELCVGVIEADGDVHPRESLVLRTALDHWVLAPVDQARVELLVYGLDFQVVPRGSASRVT